MIDISASYNKYGFIGNEFLTWLLFLIENDIDELSKINNSLITLELGDRIVMENIQENVNKTITIRGDGASLEEVMTALGTGALVSEINLSYKNNDQNWKFTLTGRSLKLTSLKSPKTIIFESGNDIEGVFLEKVYLYITITEFIDTFFEHFIKIRLSKDWIDTTVISIKSWINQK